jgi:hypothetical protein
MKNWWYYYKWYVLCGIVLFLLVCDLIGNALGLWKKKPDVQIAYVGENELPADTIAALEAAFASLAGDYNGDGSVIVTVNQYVSNSQSADSDSVYYEYASEVGLLGDITDCDSYFFLTDNPSNLQRGFQILANADGSCPDETDTSIEGKVILWTDSPLLAKLNLGSYQTTILGQEVTGDSNELVSSLYLGRRCFTDQKTVANFSECIALWEKIIRG